MHYTEPCNNDLTHNLSHKSFLFICTSEKSLHQPPHLLTYFKSHACPPYLAFFKKKKESKKEIYPFLCEHLLLLPPEYSLQYPTKLVPQLSPKQLRPGMRTLVQALRRRGRGQPSAHQLPGRQLVTTLPWLLARYSQSLNTCWEDRLPGTTESFTHSESISSLTLEIYEAIHQNLVFDRKH